MEKFRDRYSSSNIPLIYKQIERLFVYMHHERWQILVSISSCCATWCSSWFELYWRKAQFPLAWLALLFAFCWHCPETNDGVLFQVSFSSDKTIFPFRNPENPKRGEAEWDCRETKLLVTKYPSPTTSTPSPTQPSTQSPLQFPSRQWTALADGY